MERESEVSRVRLGEVLMHRGQAQFLQIDFLLSLQEAYRTVGRERTLGELLLEHRVISETGLAEALHQQEHMPLESITKIIEAMKDFPKTYTGVLVPD
jgi:hypothetical protein